VRDARTDVLVVGAGPVGLALAIELGSRGVRVTLIERNDRGGSAPRAKTTNVRTRTHLRRWGIADKLAAASPFGVDYPNNMVFVTRLAGPELARFTDAFNAAPARDNRYPEHAQWVPQYTLERVMLEHARTLPGVDILFGVTLTESEQDNNRVLSRVVDIDGREREIVSEYLVGADGARSRVRELIGARMVGRAGLSHHYNIIFRAPGWAGAHRHGPAAIYWQIGTDGLSVIGPMDQGDLWYFMPGGAKPGDSLSKEEAAALIRQRCGIDLPVEVLSADNWTANELLADRYRAGRIFLAGDACHLHPPAGGYGMNMGVGDSVDLGWKLAATLNGWGGPALLNSYEIERRQVHQVVIDEAMANYAIFVEPPPVEIEDDTAAGEAARTKLGAAIQASKGREFATLGTVLGLCYQSPLIAKESEPCPEHISEVYKPSGHSGCLAPHAWLDDGSSLYDLFGPDFTLLVAAGANRCEVGKAFENAKALGIPLKILDVPSISIAELYGASLVLIRPDQHVAWRGNHWEDALAPAAGHELALA
jgi:2-polyprenyl-6-methoxyphenol hydroxylase-like FAD-dependent oxidoreductase